MQEALIALWVRVMTTLSGGEEGFSTAELLGNAALAIAALVAIWAGMRALGVDIVAWIRGQLGVP